MAENQRAKLASTIFTQYRDHCGLFWRIMLPVVIIAIALEVALFFYSVTRVENYIDDIFREVYTTSSNVNTISGVYPTMAPAKRDVPADASTPDLNLQVFSTLSFSSTDSDGTTWKWGLNFQTFDYSPLILLLLTLCPLSLAVAQIARGSTPQASVSLTARDIWRQTGRKFWGVLGAPLLFVLIVDVGTYLYLAILWLVRADRPLHDSLLDLAVSPYLFGTFVLLQCYLLVTLSLYNPCLILENNSIIGVFSPKPCLGEWGKVAVFWCLSANGLDSLSCHFSFAGRHVVSVFSVHLRVGTGSRCIVTIKILNPVHRW